MYNTYNCHNTLDITCIFTSYLFVLFRCATHFCEKSEEVIMPYYIMVLFRYCSVKIFCQVGAFCFTDTEVFNDVIFFLKKCLFGCLFFLFRCSFSCSLCCPFCCSISLITLPFRCSWLICSWFFLCIFSCSWFPLCRFFFWKRLLVCHYIPIFYLTSLTLKLDLIFALFSVLELLYTL